MVRQTGAAHGYSLLWFLVLCFHPSCIELQACLSTLCLRAARVLAEHKRYRTHG